MTKKIGDAYVVIDDMTWPLPGERLHDVAWTLVHGRPTDKDLFTAAAVMGAYNQMVIKDTAKKRNYIIREIREVCNGPRKERHAMPSDGVGQTSTPISEKASVEEGAKSC